jgi:hypothetical protein
MSILDGGGACEETYISPQKCKRDYEGEISRIKTRLKNIAELQDSAVQIAKNPQLRPLTTRAFREGLAMVVGAALLEGEASVKRLDKLIEEYANEASD